VAGISETTVRVLTPYVGPTVADTCVRGTALSLGKTSDTLENCDLPRLEEHIRLLLGPLLPARSIDRLLAEIRASA